MLKKSQIIKSILKINHSVAADWLGAFDVSALTAYLDHLQLAIEPRGAHSVWVRQAETPAVVTCRPSR